MNTRFATSLLLTTLMGATALNAAAQTPTPAAPPQAAPVAPAPAPAISLSAALEGFYQWNTNRPPDRINLLRAYDTRANTFGVQQAALVIESAPNVEAGRRAGLRVDLQFGQATDTVQGNAANEPRPGVYRHMWQAYGSYVAPWHNAQIDFGKFGSNLGFETNYAKDNNREPKDVPLPLTLIRDNYDSRSIRLDIAYLGLNLAPTFKVDLGRAVMPFRLTDMIWDRDLRIQGGSAVWSFGAGETGEPTVRLSGVYSRGSHVFVDSADPTGSSLGDGVTLKGGSLDLGFGSATRVDLQISQSGEGELLLTSRQDGMIRMLVPDAN